MSDYITIYLVWKSLPDSHQHDYDDRLIAVCDSIEKARHYRDSLHSLNYITKETINHTLTMETVE